MYSRYLPDGNGGYRRQLQAQNRHPEPPHDIPPAPGPEPGRRPAPPQSLPPQHRPGPPGGHRPGMVGRPPPAPLFGGLGTVLGRLDTEDFLILAVLLLAMKEDGASRTELLIAAGLYMLLGN